MTLILFFLLIFSLTGCSDNHVSNFVNAFSMQDSIPPVLEKVITEDSNTVRVVFNETVKPRGEFLDNYSVSTDGLSILIDYPDTLEAGNSSTITGEVADLVGNSTLFTVTVWGYNSNPASLEFNEFTTKGTEKSPDRTELLVSQSGSIAGLTVYDGVPGNSRSLVVLPNTDVKKGDFIVIYWTETFPSGVTEHPQENVWNFCANTSTGISENNGIQCLSCSPSEGDEVLDCIVYSSYESSQYEGFGTKEVYERVKTAQENNWWTSEAINSKKSTATRSLSKKDGVWYVTVTGGSTFGAENTSDEYGD